MKDALAMNVFQRDYDAPDEEFRLLLSELPVPCNVVAEVAPSQQVHHEVQVLPVLERVLHVDYEAIQGRSVGATYS